MCKALRITPWTVGHVSTGSQYLSPAALKSKRYPVTVAPKVRCVFLDKCRVVWLVIWHVSVEVGNRSTRVVPG